MATPTTHLGLLKPGYQDPYDIATINANWDLIDAAADRVDTTGSFLSAFQVTTSHLTLGSGWTFADTSSRLIIQGRFAYIRLKLEKNAIIPIAASDDIANEIVATLDVAYRPKEVSPMVGILGRCVWGALETNGLVNLGSISGGNAGTDLPAGSFVDLSCHYILASA